MGVETAFAVGAEQMGHTHASLSQDQLEVGLLALGADFADAAEGEQVERRAVAVERVDDGTRIEFAQDKVAVFMMAAASVG
jgi:hypothetical protein